MGSLSWEIPLFFGAMTTLCAAQGADFSLPSSFTDWDNQNWVLSTRDLLPGYFQSRAPMGNGYLGCALGTVGPFFEQDINYTDPNGGSLPINGWPLDNPRQTFCTVSGFFNSQRNTTRTNFPELLLKGGESVIAGIPNWPNLILQVDGATLDARVDNTTISNFYSSRSLKNGLQTWNYTWSPTSNGTIDIAYEMFMDRSDPNIAAVRLSFKPSTPMTITVTDLLDGRGAVRSDPHETGMLVNSSTIYSAVSPHWLNNITAWIYSTVQCPYFTLSDRMNASDSFYLPSNGSTIGQSWTISATAATTITVSKYIGIASSDGFVDPQATAMNASLSAEQAGFDALFGASTNAWAVLLDEDLVDDYTLPNGSLPSDPNVVDMQIISKANAHYLLQNLLPENGDDLNHWSVSVGGLGSDSYAGQVFWDADTFMAPGVAAAHPNYAAQIPKYRVMLSKQAAANAAEYNFSSEAIIYPWTSGRYGNCTGTGPCVDYQYHINSDIFLNNLIYWRITGDTSWFADEAVPVNDAIVHMFSELVKYNQTVAGYGIQNLTDPDEYANQVPDGAFTLASLAKIMELTEEYAQNFSIQVESNLSTIANNIALPFAPSGLLEEYLGANNTAVIKQDDVDLINYPLDYSSVNYTQADKLASLDYYSVKQSADGPAMTYSLYSISANALSPSGCAAYTLALNGFQPYTRAPWYQFSEQQVDNVTLNGGTNPAFPFMTGAGGWHQVGPMGWLGARFVEEQLIIQPSLPPQIPYASIRTIIFGAAGLKATMNYTHTTIKRVDVAKYLSPNSSYPFANKAMPFTVGFDLASGQNMTISMNETLTIENRLYFENATTSGNIVQCLPVSSPSDDLYQPGQFPLSAIDGAASTRWQPSTNTTASFTIDMSSKPFQPVSGVSFDWGRRPATSVEVIFWNSTSSLSANGTSANPFSNDSVSQTSITVSSVGISTPYDATTNDIVQPYVGNMSAYAFATEIWTGNFATVKVMGCAENDGLGATVAEFNIIDTSGGGIFGTGAVNGTGTSSAGVSVATIVPSVTSGAPGAIQTAPIEGSGNGSSALSNDGGSVKLVNSASVGLMASMAVIWATLMS